MEKIYFTIEEMIDSIKKISVQLVDSNYDPEVIISVNRGGCTPGIYLSHYLNKPHEVINIELRDSNIEPDLISIKEKIKQFNSVLIIDDINDSGKTIGIIKDQTILTQTINIRTFMKITPHIAKISPTQIIYQNKYEILPFLLSA